MDKFQIASVRTCDTIYGYFAGNHHATTIDNARATSELLKGIRNYAVKEQLIPETPLFNDTDSSIRNIDHGHPYSIARLLSNFAKHADRDTNAAAPNYNNNYVVFSSLLPLSHDYVTLFTELHAKGLLDYATPPEDAATAPKPKALAISDIFQQATYGRMLDLLLPEIGADISKLTFERGAWAFEQVFAKENKERFLAKILEDGLWPASTDGDIQMKLPEKPRISMPQPVWTRKP